MTYLLGESSTYVINSKNRINSTDSSSSFSHVIKLPAENAYDRVCLLNAVIPHSYYQVVDKSSQNRGANQFNINIDDGATITVHTITIPVGNYTRFGIANVLTNLISAVIPNSSVSYPQESLETNTGKLKFNIENAGLDTITFTFPETLNTSYIPPIDISTSKYIMDIIGFLYGTKTLTIANPAVIYSEIPIHTREPDTLFINSDCVKGTDQDFSLQEIDVSNNEQNIVFKQHDVLGNSRILSHNSHKFFRFTLTSSRDDYIDLNGLDYTFTILFFAQNHESLFQLQQLKLDNIEKINKTKKLIESRVLQEQAKKQIHKQISVELDKPDEDINKKIDELDLNKVDKPNEKIDDGKELNKKIDELDLNKVSKQS